MLPPREYTDNLHLDLYMPCDRPNLRDQYNTSMQKLDRAFKDLDDRDRMFASDVQTLDTAARQAREKALENGHAIDSIEARLDLIDDELKGKAPIYHASPHSDFGIGERSLYGHVKLSDDYLGNETISDGTASTPHAIHNAYNDLMTLINQIKMEMAQQSRELNFPRRDILTYKPANGTWYNSTNVTAYYRMGVVVIGFHDAPLPKDEMLGGDAVNDQSATVGYIPKAYCPSHDLGISAMAFSTWDKKAFPSSPETLSNNPVTIKIHNDGRLVVNRYNVGFVNNDPTSNPGMIDGFITYIVPDINIIDWEK